MYVKASLQSMLCGGDTFKQVWVPTVARGNIDILIIGLTTNDKKIF